MNRFVWDLRYPGARELPVPTGFVSAEYPRAQAPVAPPGRYVARLAAGGQQYEQSFDIKRDPRLTATDEDLQAEFELMVKIRNRLSDVTDAIDRLRKVRQQLNERQRSGAKDPALVSAKEKLQAIEAALTRLPGPNSNMLPPKALNDRLAALSGEIQHACVTSVNWVQQFGTETSRPSRGRSSEAMSRSARPQWDPFSFPWLSSAGSRRDLRSASPPASTRPSIQLSTQFFGRVFRSTHRLSPERWSRSRS
jgi:hypothetical protein